MLAQFPQSLPNHQTPRIFDETFDSFDSDEYLVGLDDLPDKAGFLYPMSYNKSVQSSMLHFQSSPSVHDPSIGYYAPPHSDVSQLLFADYPDGIQDSDFAYSAGPEYSHHAFPDSRISPFDARLQDVPTVVSYTPEGHERSTASVYLQTVHDLLAPPRISFSLHFGASRVAAHVQLQSFNDRLREYAVSCAVPPFPSTGSHTLSAIPLQLVMATNNKSVSPTLIDIGTFAFTQPIDTLGSSRKRKASVGSEYDLQPPQKRTFHTQAQIQDQGQESFDADQTSPYSTLVPTPTSTGAFHSQTRTNSPRPNGHHYSTSTASQVSLTAPSPFTPAAYSPSFATVKTEHSPRPPMTPGPRPASAASTHKAAPKLVRTSTIQQSPPQINSGAGPVSYTQSFNPYSMYPLKASLKLNGDLDAIAKKWTDEEKDAGRKLVEFTRAQSGNTINASFKTVKPDQRQAQNITISCIWWKEKNDSFVTSVDTIYLLEALVGVRFTVEEKNRIRRNLEGFRPLTVSKAKLDSEEFFKVIMGFPNPKPRNIEKDVKVFPWKILSTALKKIIGKYSASYSSTASAMFPPTPSMYSNTEAHPDYVTYSPHNEIVTTSMQGYPVVTTAGYSPSLHPGRVSVPVTTAPVPNLSLQVPTMGPTYNLSANYGFQTVTAPPHSATLTPQVMSAPTVRMPQTWEYSPFVHENPAAMGPHSASAAYPRGSIETAEFITPVSYAMNHKR